MMAAQPHVPVARGSRRQTFAAGEGLTAVCSACRAVLYVAPTCHSSGDAHLGAAPRRFSECDEAGRMQGFVW